MLNLIKHIQYLRKCYQFCCIQNFCMVELKVQELLPMLAYVSSWKILLHTAFEIVPFYCYTAGPSFNLNKCHLHSLIYCFL